MLPQSELVAARQIPAQRLCLFQQLIKLLQLAVGRRVVFSVLLLKRKLANGTVATTQREGHKKQIKL